MVTLFAVILSATAVSDQRAEPLQQPRCAQSPNQLGCARGDPTHTAPPGALRQRRHGPGVHHMAQLDVSFGAINKRLSSAVNKRLSSAALHSAAKRSDAGKAGGKRLDRCGPPEVSNTTLWVPTTDQLRCMAADEQTNGRRSAASRSKGHWVPEAVVGAASVLTPGPASMVSGRWNLR